MQRRIKRPTARSPRHRRRWAWAIALALILVTLIVAGRVFFERFARQKFEAELAAALPKLEAKTGLALAFGGLHIGLDGNAALEHVAVGAESDIGQPFLTIERLEILADLDIGARRATIEGVRLVRPVVSVELREGGRTNLPAFLARLLGAPRVSAGGELPAGDSLADAFGDHVDVPDQVRVEFVDGAVRVRNQGRFGPVPADLLGLAGTSGVLTLDRPTSTVSIHGKAANENGGRLDFALDFSRAAQDLHLVARKFSLARLSPIVPNIIHLSDETIIDGSVAVQRRSGDARLRVAVDAGVKGLAVSHFRLASTEVTGIATSIAGEMLIDPDQHTMSSKHLEVRLGKAAVHLKDLNLRLGGGKPFLLETKLATTKLAVQDVLDGLPRALIPEIKGATFKGSIDIDASLVVDLERVQRSGLEVTGGVTGLRAISVPPRIDVRRVKSPSYEHAVRRQGLIKKAIIVGPANEDFVPLDAVGSYLRGAVLTCEDGSFFRHHGFMLRHINDSLRRDLRDRRFVRGASTISMQLAKNLFLSHEKTLSRKLQEALLTWWMEEEVDKDRMLELYFNIIEWGPDIYGVGPASRHYFHRHPSKLRPIQAAWLASIIMNPVRYYYMKAGGSVSPGWRSTLAFIMAKMRDRGTITQEDLDAAAENDFSVPFGSTDLDKEKEDADATAAQPAPIIAPAP